MLSFFCPYCWRRVSENDSICPKCGGDIRAADARPFAEKLRAALRHSEPQTRVRAAWILGERKEASGVPDLTAVVIEADDAFVAEAAVEALGKIGAQEAIAVLEQAQNHGTVSVRWAAHRALDQIKSRCEQRLEAVPRRCGWDAGHSNDGRVGDTVGTGTDPGG